MIFNKSNLEILKMILDSEINSIKTGWREIIKNWIKNNPKKWYELNANYETGIKSFKGHLEIFPKKEMIFRCFNYFEPTDTHVVILGQDPYHGKNQAIGVGCGNPEMGKFTVVSKGPERERFVFG